MGAPSPQGVVLGPSSTALTYRFAQALARTWRAGDEIVLTRLDHEANVRPWVQAAEPAGVTVRWADPDLTPSTCRRSRSPRLARAPDPAGRRDRRLQRRGDPPRPAGDQRTPPTRSGRCSTSDGVHATPHGPVDVAALGADFWTTSAYKWSGPHLAALVAAPDLLEGLHPDKLDSVADVVPDRFERGTPPFAQHAGAAAAVEHLASLVPAPHASVRAPAAAPGVDGGGRGARGGAAAPAAGRYRRTCRTCAASGAVRGRRPPCGSGSRDTPRAEVAEHCARARINVWSGHNYAWELAGLLGIRDSGSAVRAGMSCYTTRRTSTACWRRSRAFIRSQVHPSS